MLTVNVGPDLIEAIRMCYNAKRSVLLEGSTGVGKSEALKECAARLGIEYVVRDLSLMEAPDLAGMPVVKRNQTCYAAPSFLPTGGRGLLVFEELNRAPRYTQAPCLQLLTERRLNDYKLPDGWLPMAAINPAEGGKDEYLVDEMDPALMARFVVLHVKPDVKCWLRWAESNKKGDIKMHPAIMDFVGMTPKIFDAPKSNPRAWKYASDLVNEFDKKRHKLDALLTNLAGLVDDKLARAFVKMYQDGTGEQPPLAEALLRSYGRHRKKVLGWKKAGKTPLLDKCCEQILVFLEIPAGEDMVLQSRTMLANLQKYLADIPADLRNNMLKYGPPWLRGGK